MLHLEIGSFKLFAVWSRQHYDVHYNDYVSRGVRVAWVPRGVPTWCYECGLERTRTAA